MIRKIIISIGLLLLTGVAAAASPQPVPTPENVVFKGYRDISIGMTADAVRQKLGDPKDKSDAMDLYLFSDKESAQFYYEAGKVNAIMVTYAGDLSKAPTAIEIFGFDAEANADGGIFKMVRYPKAGFWISYNRTTGDDAVVNIAVQRI